MDDAKLIIVDDFDDYIDELTDCAKKSNIGNVIVCKDEIELSEEIKRTPLDIILLVSISDTIPDFDRIIYLLERENVLSTSIFVIDPTNKKEVTLIDAHDGQWLDATTTYGETAFEALRAIYDDIIAQEQEELAQQDDVRQEAPANQEENGTSQQARVQEQQAQPNRNLPPNPKKKKREKDAYTIVMASPKGGTGKSTLSMEVAYLLARNKKRRICLLDLNPSFDTLSATIDCVKREHNYQTIYNFIDELNSRCYNLMTTDERHELIESDEQDFFPYFDKYNIELSKEDIQQLLIHDPKTGDKTKRDTGLWILPAISLPFDVEYIQQKYVTKIIEILKTFFDFIVIDTADNLVYITVEGYKEADRIYLVTSHSVASAAVLAKLTSNLEQLDMDSDDFRLIVNSPNGNFYEKNPRTISKALHIKLSGKLPFDQNIQKNHAKGRPYSVYNPKSKFSKAIEPVIREIEEDAYDKAVGGNF